MEFSKEYLKDFMSMPSCSEKESMIRDYILQFAKERGIAAKVAPKGNVYLTKGLLSEGEYYPCLVNHMDTVHFDQAVLVDSGERLKIQEEMTIEGKTILRAVGTGIGADDKLGCAIALAILDEREKCKAAFFVQEEQCMLGSKAMDTGWFKDVSFVLSFDSPGRNRASRSCSGRLLYSDEFFLKHLRSMCAANGVTSFNHEPFTDVVQIRDKTDIMCFNVGNGGYNAHRPDEYLVVEDAQATCKLGHELLESIGMRFTMRMSRPTRPRPMPTSSRRSARSAS